MSTRDYPERFLGPMLESIAAPRVPDYLPDVLGRTRRTRQRPAWTFPERWLPMSILTMRTAQVPRPAFVLLILAVLLALLGAVIFVGSQRQHSVVPPPTGLAKNGLIAFDAGGRILVANPDGSGSRVINGGYVAAYEPTWSPDGTRIAFWSMIVTNPHSLVVAGADGSGATEVARSPAVPAEGMYYGWSPDSSRLAFSIDGGNGRVELATVAADGRDLKVLAAGAGVQREAPSWSPDGQWLAYRGTPTTVEATQRFGAGQGLFVMHPDGTGERRLATSAGGDWAFTSPQWSPDSTKLLFAVGSDPNHDLALFGLVTGRETILSDDPANEAFYAFSPAGDLIAFQRYVETDPASPPIARIYLVRPDGSGLRLLQTPDLTIGPPSFSPDGKLLLGYTAPDMRVALIPIDGSPVSYIDAPGNLGIASWQRLAP